METTRKEMIDELVANGIPATTKWATPRLTKKYEAHMEAEVAKMEAEAQAQAEQKAQEQAARSRRTKRKAARRRDNKKKKAMMRAQGASTVRRYKKKAIR